MMRHLRKRRFSAGFVPNIDRPLQVALFFCAWLPALYFLSGTAIGAMDLSDEPMLAKIKAAPANIMIVLDDSGSMTFEILIQGQYDGRFPNPRFEQPDADGFCYIFDYLGDNAYAYDSSKDRWADRNNRRYMLEDSRIYWKSQYSGVNVMYYNPALTYSPWPNYPGQTFANADTETPAPDPIKTGARSGWWSSMVTKTASCTMRSRKSTAAA
jgi:type IV pilus assembly protein PilY1